MKNKKLFAILTLVCFMFTLMPVAAFAAVDAETSSFVAVDGDQSVRLDNAKTEGVKFDLALNDANEDATTGTVYIWAEASNGAVTSALNVPAGAPSNIDNVWAYEATAANEEVVLQFVRTGVYKVYAAPAPTNPVDGVEDLNKFVCEFSTITVKTAADDPESYIAVMDGEKVKANNKFVKTLNVTPNNVMSQKIYVNFEDADGKALKNETVYIDTNSASIEVNRASDVTNSQGQIDFKVAGSVEGKYEISLTLDGVEWIIEVIVGNTSAAYIETVKDGKSPLALFSDFEDEEAIAFVITDINGNAVTDKADQGMEGIAGNDVTNEVDGETYAKGSFVVLTEAPADSDLTSDVLTINYSNEDQVWYLEGVNTMDAEGTYAVKVILDNGAYATAEWTVKKFQTPVRLMLGYATTTIELGSATTAKMFYIDANGVQKLAKDAEFAATGYAVAKAGVNTAANFPEDKVTVEVNGEEITKVTAKGAGYGKVVAKSDEKYVGSKINVTAVSEKYDLVGTAVLTVAEGASAIVVSDANAEVNVNNKIAWNVVDGAGNKVTLTNGVSVDNITYVVLDKPEGAKVSVNDATNVSDLNSKGEGKMALTSNKVGNVTVQVVLKATYAATAGDDNMQVKYYTGVAVIPVGTDNTGDVVVMSIGSNEIVINDKVGTIAAAPLVQNDRTFVPFRALSEAFGAEVAWDEATQSVTAELNGVKVVLTIGSAAYTVNGEARTADVAPFINGASTMVPVRFVAEAFGIKVIPTYNPDGTTADILFNL